MKRTLLSPFAVALSTAAFSQTTLKGSVTDELGYPLPGVSIVAKGSGYEAIEVTNSEGEYLLPIPEGGISVRVAYAGYFDQVLVVQTPIRIDVQLEPIPGFKRARAAQVVYRRHNATLSK